MFRKIISLIIAVFMIFAIGVNVFATNVNSPVDDEFDILSIYDIVNTNEWNKMSRAERVSACQISPDKLFSMSTDELAQVVIEYPFFVDILAFDDVKTGYEFLLSECRALQELTKRDDRVYGILNVCSGIEPQTVNADTSLNAYRNSKYVEILLEQDDFANVMTEEQMTQRAALISTDYRKSTDNKVQTENSVESPLPSLLKNNFNGARTAVAVVYTPNGSAVSVERWNNADDDFTYDEKVYWNKIIAQAYPNAVKLSNPTRKYNCHSYAWYSQSTANIMWMDNPSKYMTDGSYNSVSKSKATAGDRIVYYSSSNGSYTGINHSAIISSKSILGKITVKSKWGQLGLYQHAWDDSPYSIYNKMCDTKFYHR